MVHTCMTIHIERVGRENRQALQAFATLHTQIYRTMRYSMPHAAANLYASIEHQTPFTKDRSLQPFVAWHQREVVACAMAVADQRYCQHWNEALGHIIMFAALPHSYQASRLLLNAACQWLYEQGLTTVRIGFGPFETGIMVDDPYGVLPSMMRYTPAYYHSLLKNAGFAPTIGVSEYMIEVSEQRKQQYTTYIETAQQHGYELVPLHAIPDHQCTRDFTLIWNKAYASHWGLAPMTEDEFTFLFQQVQPPDILTLSAIAYQAERPVGAVLVYQQQALEDMTPRWLRLRHPRPCKHLNSFAVGVAPDARRHGISLALAAHAYLPLIAQGQHWLSYGVVVDTNWASQRVAEKLGAFINATYLTYDRQSSAISTPEG